MKRSAFVCALFLAASVLVGQTIPELFNKSRDQVKAGSWKDALATLDTVDAEAAKPGNDGIKKQLEGPSAFYRGVCEANLDQADKARADFGTFLRVQPNATIDTATYSKKAVAAFEDARKAAQAVGTGTPSLYNAYQDFKAPPASKEPPDEKWAAGPVQWIMTADDKKAWAQLANGNVREEFVEKFWESRNPTPGSPANDYKASFDKRVAFADAYFTQDEEKPGSLTDRGMVIILLGPPTYGGRKPLRTGEDASDQAGMSTVGSQDAAIAQKTQKGMGSSGKSAAVASQYGGDGKVAPESAANFQEVWHYRKELLPKGVSYQQVDITFITRKGYGANTLQRESQTLTTLESAKKPPVPVAASAKQ
jgi:GWxTD domain-containing protein